jgi:predicted transcriptional regulator
VDSRRGCISQVRLQIAYQLVQDYGIPLAEVARHLGVSTSAISKAIIRRTKEWVKLVNYVPNFLRCGTGWLDSC